MLDNIIQKCINKKCKYKTLKNTSRIVINKSLKRKHNKLLGGDGKPKAPKVPKPSKLTRAKAGILSSLGSKSASTQQKLNMDNTALTKKIVNKNKTSSKVLRGIFKYTVKKPLKLGLLPATIPAKYAIKKVIQAKRYLFGSTKDLEKIDTKIKSVDKYIEKLEGMKANATTDAEKAALSKEIEKQHSLRDKLNAESMAIYNKKDSTIGKDLINFTRKVKYGFTDGGDTFKRVFKNAGWKLFKQRNRVANNLEKSAENIQKRIDEVKNGKAYYNLTPEEKAKKIAKLNNMKNDLIRSARYNRQVGQEMKTGSVFTYFTKNAERGNIRNGRTTLLDQNAKTENDQIKAVLVACPDIKKTLKSMNIPVDDISKLGDSQKSQLIKLYNTVLNPETGTKDASRIENIRRNFIYGMINNKASNNLSAATFKRHKDSVNNRKGDRLNSTGVIKPNEPGTPKLNSNGVIKPEYKSSTERFEEYYKTLPDYKFSNNNIAQINLKIRKNFNIKEDDPMFKAITKPGDINNNNKIPTRNKITGALIKNEFEIYKLQQLLNDDKITDPGIYINIKRKISELQDEQKKMKSREDEMNKKLQDKFNRLAHLQDVRNQFKEIKTTDDTNVTKTTYTYPKIRIVNGKVFVTGTKTSKNVEEYDKSLKLINTMIPRKTEELDTITKTQNTQLDLVAKGRFNNANTLRKFNNDSRRFKKKIPQLQKLNRNDNKTISKSVLVDTINKRVEESREMLVKALNEPDPIKKKELVEIATRLQSHDATYASRQTKTLQDIAKLEAQLNAQKPETNADGEPGSYNKAGKYALLRTMYANRLEDGENLRTLLLQGDFKNYADLNKLNKIIRGSEYKSELPEIKKNKPDNDTTTAPNKQTGSTTLIKKIAGVTTKTSSTNKTMKIAGVTKTESSTNTPNQASKPTNNKTVKRAKEKQGLIRTLLDARKEFKNNNISLSDIAKAGMTLYREYNASKTQLENANKTISTNIDNINKEIATNRVGINTNNKILEIIDTIKKMQENPDNVANIKDMVSPTILLKINETLSTLNKEPSNNGTKTDYNTFSNIVSKIPTKSPNFKLDDNTIEKALASLGDIIKSKSNNTSINTLSKRIENNILFAKSNIKLLKDNLSLIRKDSKSITDTIRQLGEDYTKSKVSGKGIISRLKKEKTVESAKKTISELKPQLQNIKPDELRPKSTELQTKIQADEKTATALTTSINDKKNFISQLTGKLTLDNGNALKAESTNSNAQKLNIADVTRTSSSTNKIPRASSSTNTIPREKTNFISSKRNLITELLNQQDDGKFADLKARYKTTNARVLITSIKDADLIKQLFEKSIKVDSNQLEAVKTKIASNTQTKTDIDSKLTNYQNIQNSIFKAEADIEAATYNPNNLKINAILKRISNTNLSKVNTHKLLSQLPQETDA